MKLDPTSGVSPRFVRWASAPFVLLLACAGVGQVTVRSEVSPRPAFELRPGVIVDPQRAVMFLMRPGNRIDAVRLSSGESVWSTAAAARPLLLHEDLLIAQAASARGALDVVLLDVGQAGRKVREVEVELPRGARATVDDGIGASFDVDARMHGDDLIVSWRFSERRVDGVAPGPDGRPSGHGVEGVARIDLESGRVEALEPDAVPAAAGPRLPAAVRRLVESGALPGPPWRAGSVLAAVERGTSGDRETVVLKRWNAETGEPLPDLTPFDAGFRVKYPSADFRHLLTSRSAPADGDPWRPWVWSIHALETGEAVGRIPNHAPAARFFVWGASVIHESRPYRRRVGDHWESRPLELRAIGLAHGEELWSRPLRDTAYRGPHPPRPSS